MIKALVLQRPTSLSELPGLTFYDLVISFLPLFYKKAKVATEETPIP
jgi:hypothetical protein